MRASLDAPDHSALSRRGQLLDVALHDIPTTGPLYLIVDSTGHSVVGEGEWAAATNGGRGTRGWKKLHLGVDRFGAIVGHALTDATVDDATVGIGLIVAASGHVVSVTADSAYDTVAFYEAVECATRAVPPTRTAKVSRRGPRSNARDRVITDVERLGRREWKKASGYDRQARVENAFFRYMSVISDGVRARSVRGREVEARLACRVLNRMTALGRPGSRLRAVGDEPARWENCESGVEPCTNAEHRGDRLGTQRG
ncbi:Transposase DDE domain protein [Luteitalea pratensis]|uniref:Transposase DDE domain protein n=1 Tax=Luteitalea pratensis TaxID=1855912 RepID=A0A143PN33_LUTPR|nr:transposase [Luteitalea pratensis]AMY09498.1 Transposase DDE domain protein [Luteitalea pratensis]